MTKQTKRETKVGEFFPVNVDDAQGLVDHVVTVFGIVDEGNDVAHPGSFTKTIVERAGKIRVLDMHNHDSIMSVLGKPIRLWEVDRAGLPEFVKAKYPEATGALMATTKFLLDTAEGKGAFIRIREGAVNEFSYTYDALDTDYGKAKKDGKEVTVRNLRSIRLWEISPVLWGMNQATGVVDVKAAADEKPEDEKPEDEAPAGGEEKPYEVRHEGDEYCVYKRDGNESMGCHPSEDEANGQIAAIYAGEKAAKYSEDQGRDEQGRFGSGGGGGSNDFAAGTDQDPGGGADTGGEGGGGGRSSFGTEDLGDGNLRGAESIASGWVGSQDSIPSTLNVRDVVQAAGGKEGVDDYLRAAGRENASQEDVADRLFSIANEIETLMLAEHEEITTVTDNAERLFGWVDNNYDESAEYNPLGEGKSGKAGRVLSAANVTRITAAMVALHEALQNAGVVVQLGVEDKPKSEQPVKALGAGSGETPPTVGTEELKRLADDGLMELKFEELD